MSQAASAPADRRQHPRSPAAFAFWYEAPNEVPCAGWMMNLSEGGAAFLVEPGNQPALGSELTLTEMPTESALVRRGAPRLPRLAHVLRVEPSETGTHRVAVRFAAPMPARPRSRQVASIGAALHEAAAPAQVCA